jgi:two-component system, chemotaxis family, chemotaxis protein CheY
VNREPRPTTQLKYQLAGTGTFKAGAPPAALVLVVDDDADMTRFVSAVLSSGGITAVAAYDAIQGFLVAQRQMPKLILVDWHMPAGGGPQVLRKLHDHPRTATIPVYVITADDSADIPAEAALLGAKGVLRKPLEPTTLLALATPLVG